MPKQYDHVHIHLIFLFIFPQTIMGVCQLNQAATGKSVYISFFLSFLRSHVIRIWKLLNIPWYFTRVSLIGT